jgi:hypothetical protein
LRVPTGGHSRLQLGIVGVRIEAPGTEMMPYEESSAKPVAFSWLLKVHIKHEVTQNEQSNHIANILEFQNMINIFVSHH